VLRVFNETNCQMRRTLVHTPTGFFNCHMRIVNCLMRTGVYVLTTGAPPISKTTVEYEYYSWYM
jgi:hypothetical protein